jgi:hypothetical protein
MLRSQARRSIPSTSSRATRFGEAFTTGDPAQNLRLPPSNDISADLIPFWEKACFFPPAQSHLGNPNKLQHSRFAKEAVLGWDATCFPGIGGSSVHMITYHLADRGADPNYLRNIRLLMFMRYRQASAISPKPHLNCGIPYPLDPTLGGTPRGRDIRYCK